MGGLASGRSRVVRARRGARARCCVTSHSAGSRSKSAPSSLPVSRPLELSRERLQAIALATRRTKTYGVDGASWREQARARAAEHGLGANESSRRCHRARSAPSPDAPDLERQMRRLSGPEGLTERHNTFARRHALAELAGEFAQGATITDSSARLTATCDPTVAPLQPGLDDDEPVHDARAAGARARLLAGRAAPHRRAHRDPRRERSTGVSTHLPQLSAEQAQAVRAITDRARARRRDRARRDRQDHDPRGARGLSTSRPAGRWSAQRRQLAPRASSANCWDRGRHHPRATRGAATRGGFAPHRARARRGGTAPTRASAALFTLAERAGAKVIAVGDPGQLTSVEAGGWLAAIADRPRTGATPGHAPTRPRRTRSARRAPRRRPRALPRHKHDRDLRSRTEHERCSRVRDSRHAAPLDIGRAAAR